MCRKKSSKKLCLFSGSSNVKMVFGIKKSEVSSKNDKNRLSRINRVRLIFPPVVTLDQ